VDEPVRPDGLPADDASAAPTPVLVVVHDADYGCLASEALEKGGRFRTTRAGSAAEAHSHDVARFGAAVVDRDLPASAGMDLLREIRATSEIPVVMLSGPSAVEAAVASIRAGAFSCLAKTTENLDLLPEVVSQAVDDLHLRREHRTMRNQLHRVATLASLGSFASGMCHQMNNPLAAILGYTQLYERGYADIARCMQVIATSARRLSDVVNSLGSFAAGSTPPRETIDLSELVAEELEKRREILQHECVTVDFSPPGEAVPVKGNRPALMQVLSQIILNAREAMKESPAKGIAIRLTGSEGRARVEIDDTGHGVDERIRERIFDPFFSTREPGAHTGMGLSIAHRVVNGHGGRICCEPGAWGGARFVIELPSAPP
jgi:two-component system C4-dicarboxylate transport sensor histidine kinase DctB